MHVSAIVVFITRSLFLCFSFWEIMW